jgi:hypothetical protein
MSTEKIVRRASFSLNKGRMNLPDGTAHDPLADLIPSPADANNAVRSAQTTAKETHQKEQRAWIKNNRQAQYAIQTTIGYTAQQQVDDLNTVW